MRFTVLVALGLPLLSTACSTWLPAEHQAAARLTAAPLSVGNDVSTNEWPTIEWWHKYGDSALDNLVSQALASAPSIASAEARFDSAREAVRVSAASAGLRVDAEASATRLRLSDNGLFPPEFLGFNWYNQADLGLRASYSFDWWHKRAAATEAAVDSARAAQAERSAADLALSSTVVTTYFAWQGDQAQLAILDEQLTLLARRQQITRARINAELDAADHQYQLDAELAALRESRSNLEHSAQLRRIVIASLLGVSAEQLPQFTAHALPIVSAQLPAQASLDLLARRADISASRWRIEAAQQQLSVARAEFMPDISINALAALSSIDLGKLLNAGSAAPSFGAALHLPIFDSGLLKAQYGARATQVDAAVAQYNETVINAARDVASQALRLQQVSAQRQQRQQQFDATQQLLKTAQARVQQGVSDVRPVLIAQQSVAQQRAALTQLDSAALIAEIDLLTALGGGYQSTASNSSDAATP